MTAMKAFKGGYKTGDLAGAAPFAKTQAGGRRRRHRGTRKVGHRKRSSRHSSRRSSSWSLDKFFKSMKG